MNKYPALATLKRQIQSLFNKDPARVVAEFRFRVISDSDGETGFGHAMIRGDNTGSASLNLNGIEYRGRWVYSEPMQFSFSTTSSGRARNITLGGGDTATGQGQVSLISTTDPDEQLNGKFEYSETLGRGSGECLDRRGRNYHLQILSKDYF